MDDTTQVPVRWFRQITPVRAVLVVLAVEVFVVLSRPFNWPGLVTPVTDAGLEFFESPGLDQFTGLSNVRSLVRTSVMNPRQRYGMLCIPAGC